MEKYIFTINSEGHSRRDVLIYQNEFMTDYEVLGNIYNLVDYINDNQWHHSHLDFRGFTTNELSFIVGAITRYKQIVTISGPSALIISDKKLKIRGRDYDYVD